MDYEKKYKEALEKARQLCAYPTSKPFISDLQELFPELKESEDEEIREMLKVAVERTPWMQDKKEKCYEWLEAQVEQKPAWSEEDKKMSRFIGNAITTDDSSVYLKSKGIEIIDAHVWLDELKDRVQLQPKQEWSEKDEKMFGYALNMIDWYGCVDKDKSKPVSDWFKFLKYRIQPQPNPKQEWSEEDEKCLENAIMYCEWARDIAPNLYCCETSEKSINWLKSLKERYTWKPSEEQIEALNRAMYHVEDDVATQIAKLIGDLKKLREE